ncbi:MAG: carboxylesterase/lipase family protein [Brevundimonas sp.]|nr:MAG: carboxylesterase/lipase family protein [Brevundimonas sp.]
MDVTTVVSSGPIRGVRENGIARYLGVPYAAAPMGDLRFREPQPHPGWSEVRDAVSPGPSAPYLMKDFDALDLVPLVGDGWVRGDEYLNANIWTPVGREGLPVMVWIHGGAWTGGAAMAPVHDGTAFARDGIVLISIGYRLGIEGFLPIPGVPTNLGMRDMIAALRWVRENAAAFGGDPANVTLFGESAGAMSIADLMVSPLAEGLFRRAILQSGHGFMVRTPEVTGKVTRKVAKLMGVPATAEGFRSTTIEQGLEALDKVSLPTAGLDMRGDNGRDPAYGLSRFLPVYGDDVIPVPPIEALKAGKGAGVDLLIGTNAEEMNIYLVPTGVKKKLGKLLSWFLLSRSHRGAGRVLKAYAKTMKGARPGDVLAAAMTDLVFRWPARVFARAHRGRTWFYEMDWRSPAFDGELGAAHAVDVPFVFDALATGTGKKGFLGEDPPQALADRIHKIWVDFARDGSAPWPQYDDATRQVHALEKGQTGRDPDMPVEPLWS